MKPWYLYVVRCRDGTLYTGVTTDISRRVREHNESKRGAKYTKTRRRSIIVGDEEFNNRSEAQSAEYNFKKLFHKQKWEIINEDSNRI